MFWEVGVGDVGGVVVAASGGGAVAGVVLDAGDDAVRVREGGSLEAVDLGFGHAGAQEGIFAGAFHDAAPACVAGDVDHGAEGPADAGGGGFAGGHALGFFGHGGIPRGGQGEGHGVDGAEAVDDVEAEEDGDVEAGLVDSDVLEVIDARGVGDEEEGADAAGADFGFGGGVVRGVEGDLAHLADLLFEGHAVEEVFDEAGLGGVWGLSGDLAMEREDSKEGQEGGDGDGEPSAGCAAKIHGSVVLD